MNVVHVHMHGKDREDIALPCDQVVHTWGCCASCPSMGRECSEETRTLSYCMASLVGRYAQVACVLAIHGCVHDGTRTMPGFACVY